MRRVEIMAMLVLLGSCLLPLAQAQQEHWIADLTHQPDYTLHASTSSELTGANVDSRAVTPGQTLTVLDTGGPGMISHIWFTMADGEPYALKRVVLRMYWDGEKDPSVEAPIGDFFGLGTGVYFKWESLLLSAGADKALNSYFPMPFEHHARITITNEGKQTLDNLYWNIEYREYNHPLPKDTIYFHAEYRQAQPNHGWTSLWYENGDPNVNYHRNLTGKDNYVWFTAKGHGAFVGVTMSVLQNQDGWWGEGDEMFTIDGKQQIVGTGSEDYFLGAWNFGGDQDYLLHGAPQVGLELAGARSSVYRFHLDSPVPFLHSMTASIEHGHANDRSDNFYSVAYWYQSEPHQPFPPLPPMDERIPAIQFVGGPGNSTGPNDPKSLHPR